MLVIAQIIEVCHQSGYCNYSDSSKRAYLIRPNINLAGAIYCITNALQMCLNAHVIFAGLISQYLCMQMFFLSIKGKLGFVLMFQIQNRHLYKHSFLKTILG